MAQFEAYFPTNFRRYCEPFVGGGAVFFHLWNTGRVPKQTFLFDNNYELVNAYSVVRDKVDELIETLAIHKERHDKKYYYKVRRLDRQEFELNDASFTGYTPDSFDEEDQRELARVFALLAKKGALVMLSNSNTPLVRELYRKFRIETVQARRAVNSDANGRGCLPEVVVLNY